MAIHLSYDGKQNNGIIFNLTYQNGALYNGAELKPALSFIFDSFQYSEVFDALDYVELDGVKRVMTEDEALEVKALALTWIQPLGQEGNPTLEQAKLSQQSKITNDFNTAVVAISDALPHEMTSWRKQEEQARAWNIDNMVATPIIDAILASRNLGETKQQFVDIVIINADAYETAYGTILGKFQSLTKAIKVATTIAEVEAV
jgi:hypothetical protein